MGDMSAIYAYLHFGYVPDSHSNLFDLLGDLKDGKFLSLSLPKKERELLEMGVSILRKILRETVIESDTGGIHVVPVSGGLDSRAILCGLIENVDKRRIQAVTFGSPGALDYEIGGMVARIAGVQHEHIDLSSADWKWSLEAFTRTALQNDRPIWLFDSYVNRSVAERFGRHCVYWSGFMGDPLSGSHLLAKDSDSWEEARLRFVQRNRFCRSLRLIPKEVNPETYLPDSAFISPELLSYDEQLDFAIRQQCWIRYIVMPKGYNYRAPFLHPEWVCFILSLPRCYRINQRFYKKMLLLAYPEIFSLPTKVKLGLPLGASRYSVEMRKLAVKFNAFSMRTLKIKRFNPLINYVDFDWALREREDLKTLVYEGICGLKKRRLLTWIDLDTLWQAHQQGKRNFADALTLLSSLEINLRAGTFKEVVHAHSRATSHVP